MMSRETISLHRAMTPSRILMVSFAGIILLGAGLLTLPVATATGESIGFLNALFTATSSTCVTGLTTAATGPTFSAFGHVIILLLIQIGGLGTMTASAMLYSFFGRKMSLKNRITLRESMNEESISEETMRLARTAVGMTFLIEACGALLLALRMVPEFGIRGIWYSVFLAISAFCNSGMDVFPHADSLAPYASDAFVLTIISILVVLGGLGFFVLHELSEMPKRRKLRLHSKVVLAMSGALIILGALGFFIFEYDNGDTMGSMNLPERIFNSVFQSITPRTAGFFSIPQGKMANASVMMSIGLMFIGASPASTGGGIKTTTFSALLVAARSVLRGKRDVEIGRRRIGEDVLRRASAIALSFLLMITLSIVLISCIETRAGSSFTLPEISYDVVSACCTVGLSMGITPGLAPLSKLILIMGMYFGRVGPLTMLLGIFKEQRENVSVRFPEERMMVG